MTKDIMDKIMAVVPSGMEVEYEKKNTLDYYENKEEIEFINLYSLDEESDAEIFEIKELIYDILEEYDLYSVIVDNYFSSWSKKHFQNFKSTFEYNYNMNICANIHIGDDNDLGEEKHENFLNTPINENVNMTKKFKFGNIPVISEETDVCKQVGLAA